MECKYTFKKMFLTDVLLFTHLQHLLNQMGSPKYLLIFGESGGTCRPMTRRVIHCDLVAERERQKPLMLHD